MKKATFLVTGGAGFIGSNLSEQLICAGYDVKALDNFLTGKRENLNFIDSLSDDEKSRFTLIEGDIRDRDTMDSALAGVDYVLHQAALPSVPRSVEDPILSNDININGTLNLLEAVRGNGGIKKVVFAASSSAYGDTPTLPKVETMAPNPLSPYALQKFAGESYMRIFSDIFGVQTVSLRYFNVFGPRQDPTSFYSAVIPKFISALMKGESPTVYGDGEQTRDFTYIDNVVQANINAALSSGETSGKVFNIACCERISLNGLLEVLEKVMDKSANTKYEEARQGDVKHSLADISQAQKYIGYDPKVTFDEGIEKTVEFFLQQK